MSKKLREQYIKQPPRQKDESRVWNPRHGPAFCPRCRSFYDKRAWKYPTPALWKKLAEGGPKRLVFVLCPACRMEREHLYAGEIVIAPVPRPLAVELLRLIHRFAERAEARSPEHRLISVASAGGQMIVRTTENQLAGRIAEKIAETFKKRSSVAIAFSREPNEKEFIRVAFAPVKRAESLPRKRRPEKKDRKGAAIRTARAGTPEKNSPEWLR